MPGVVPLEVVRRDLLLDERAEALAEQVVLLGEERAAHAPRLRRTEAQAPAIEAPRRGASTAGSRQRYQPSHTMPTPLNE